jgi:hypothetical protein
MTAHTLRKEYAKSLERNSEIFIDYLKCFRGYAEKVLKSVEFSELKRVYETNSLLEEIEI